MICVTFRKHDFSFIRMNNPAEFKQYFNNIIGMNFLNIWITSNNINQFNETNRLINIPLYLSNKFNLGIPKFKQDEMIYLTSEREEANWLKRITWQRCVVDEENLNLYLISKRIFGDNEKLPDIPEICLKFELDSVAKIEILKKQSKICFREMFIEDQELLISSKKHWVIPIKFQEVINDNVLNNYEKQNYNSFKDIVSGLISNTNVSYTEYKGDGNITFFDKSISKGFLSQNFDENDIVQEGGRQTPDYIKNFFIDKN